jgi:type IV secretion system protein VirD4
MQKANLPDIARIIAGDVFEYARDVYPRIQHPGLARYAVKKGEESRGLVEVIETARTETSFLLDPPIARTLSGNDINFAQCRIRPTTIYIIMPAAIMDGRFFNLLLNSALGELLSHYTGSNRGR